MKPNLFKLPVITSDYLVKCLGLWYVGRSGQLDWISEGVQEPEPGLRDAVVAHVRWDQAVVCIYGGKVGFDLVEQVTTLESRE